MEKKSSNFSGQIGFVLAAAGSAVGVGKPLAFPLLGCKGRRRAFSGDLSGPGTDLGFTLLTSDIAIGRRTGESAIRAYTK